jgi:hypothetical protein
MNDINSVNPQRALFYDAEISRIYNKCYVRRYAKGANRFAYVFLPCVRTFANAYAVL